MSEKKKFYWSVFGRVRILKGYCEDCEETSLRTNDIKEASRLSEDFRKRPKREASKYERKRPSYTYQHKRLSAQGYCCFYCFRPFGSLVIRNNVDIKLKIVWDHIIPVSFSQDNQDSNFAAACQVCNSLKGKKLFKSIEEIREYVKRKWREKGYEDFKRITKR